MYQCACNVYYMYQFACMYAIYIIYVNSKDPSEFLDFFLKSKIVWDREITELVKVFAGKLEDGIQSIPGENRVWRCVLAISMLGRHRWEVPVAQWTPCLA